MGDKDLEHEIISCFNYLDTDNKKTIIKFAKFLQEDKPQKIEPTDVGEPKNIKRPDTESVISAIKRLRQTYPMLNPDSLMNEVSTQMSAHLVRGKTAVDAIDELEIVFNRKYMEIKNV